MHADESGRLAFADLLFVPSSELEKITNIMSSSPGFSCIDPEFLLEENRRLNKICEERLQLINYITGEAEKRLQIINDLNALLEKLKGEKQ